jgi:hypothetical protein
MTVMILLLLPMMLMLMREDGIRSLLSGRKLDSVPRHIRTVRQ